MDTHGGCYYRDDLTVCHGNGARMVGAILETTSPFAMDTGQGATLETPSAMDIGWRLLAAAALVPKGLAVLSRLRTQRNVAVARAYTVSAVLAGTSLLALAFAVDGDRDVLAAFGVLTVLILVEALSNWGPLRYAVPWAIVAVISLSNLRYVHGLLTPALLHYAVFELLLAHL